MARTISADERLGFGRALVVSAHPDDPEFGFGAAIARLTSEGTAVAYAICTDGSQGGEDPDQPDQELIQIREEEQRSAARSLGVEEVRFLRFPDGRLTPDLALRRAIVEEIRRWRPDLVLTHNPTRAFGIPIGASHPDHLAVGEATLAAVYPDARNPRAFRELLDQGLEAHTVSEVWLGASADPDLFIDALPWLDRKMEAILCHVSQFLGRPEFDAGEFKKLIGERMKQMGEMAGLEVAEGFRRVEAG